MHIHFCSVNSVHKQSIIGSTQVTNHYPVYSSPECTTTYIYRAFTCNRVEYHNCIETSNKYKYKHPLLLSLLRQVKQEKISEENRKRQPNSNTAQKNERGLKAPGHN